MNELLTQFPEGYNGPKQGGGSNYTKLETGDNELRILDGRVVVGYEYFTNENKPVRQKEEFKGIPADAKIEKDGKQRFPKEVWAMKVYNYKTKAVELWAVTQNSIKNNLWAYAHNQKLGGLGLVDLQIKKSGSGLSTEYTIMAIPQALTDEVKKAGEETEIDLDGYFTSSNKEDKPKDGFPDEAFANAVMPE